MLVFKHTYNTHKMIQFNLVRIASLATAIFCSNISLSSSAFVEASNQTALNQFKNISSQLISLKQAKVEYTYFDGGYKAETSKMHGIKQSLFAEVGKDNFAHLVGSNPDLNVIKNKIVFNGTKSSPFKGKSYSTEVDATKYFTK
jgi:hypothetical protein